MTWSCLRTAANRGAISMPTRLAAYPSHSLYCYKTHRQNTSPFFYFGDVPRIPDSRCVTKEGGMCVAVGSQQKSCSVRGAAAGALRSPQLLGTPQPLGAAPGAGAPLRGHAGDTPGLTPIPQGRSALKAPGRPRRRLRLRRSASRRPGLGGAGGSGRCRGRGGERSAASLPTLPPVPGGCPAAPPHLPAAPAAPGRRCRRGAYTQTLLAKLWGRAGWGGAPAGRDIPGRSGRVPVGQVSAPSHPRVRPLRPWHRAPSPPPAEEELCSKVLFAVTYPGVALPVLANKYVSAAR